MNRRQLGGHQPSSPPGEDKIQRLAPNPLGSCLPKTIKVQDQMKLYDKDLVEDWGDCVAACLRSILDIEIPQEVAQSIALGFDSFMEASDYLYREHGYKILIVVNSPEYQANYIEMMFEDVFHIMSGPGKRGCGHCVIGKGGEIFHDPHPSREGLLEIERYGFLLPVRKGS